MNGHFWIYKNTQRQWCVAGKDVEHDRFKANAGWIYTDEDILPHEVKEWKVFDGTDFRVEETIQVSDTDFGADDDMDSEGPLEPHFLWICHRFDFTSDHFVNENVEKEDLSRMSR